MTHKVASTPCSPLQEQHQGPKNNTYCCFIKRVYS